MMKFVFSMISLLAISVSVYAQTAQEWMDKLSNTYTKIPTYYIKFDMKESGNSKTYTGELFAAKEKYSLEVMDLRQMYDGKTLHVFYNDDKEITTSTPAPDSEDLLTPTKVINLYKTGYNLSLGKSETHGGKKIQFVKLTPTSKSEVDYLMVGINTTNHTLYQYKEFYKNGESRVITVKEFIENLIIPRALFKFDKSKYEKDGYIVTPI